MKRALMTLAAALLLATPGLRDCPAASPPSPGAAFPTLTEDGAWCWFADPRAFYHAGKKKQTYLGWVDSKGVVAAMAHDHDTNTSTTFEFRKVQKDDHANPSLLMRPDGRLMIFYSAHNGPDMCYRVSTRPEDITSWEPEQTFPRYSDKATRVTYPGPYVLSEENNRLYLFWRGKNLHPNFATSDDMGTSWSQVRTLVESGEKYIYFKVVSNNRDTIHIAFTDTHPRFGEKNNIYYVCYRNGAIYGANGRRIKSVDELPLAPTEADVVYDSEKQGARAWVWDIALDKQERPVIVYATFPVQTDHRYRYAAWNGQTWSDNEITSAGSTIDGEREPFYSGGIAIDQNDTSKLVLSVQKNGIHELESWTTNDAGESWTSSPLTLNSAQENVRPIIPRNHHPDIGLMWMYGNYPYYTQYETALKFAPLP